MRSAPGSPGTPPLIAVANYSIQFSYYRPIKDYIAGSGITTVTLDNPA